MKEAESALANGMLQIAIRRMVKEHPFHAHLLSPDSLVCDPGVKTMGVTICNGRIQFPYAPEFVLRCSYDELIAMFQHEINHLLFGHILADPEEYPNSDARIIAEEVTVNEWVVAPLPGQPLTLDQFPALKPLENTKTRYAYLARKTPDQGRKTDALGPKSGLSAPKSHAVGPESSPIPPGIGGVAPLDNHDIWGEAHENPVLEKLVIAAAVHEAREALDDSQWQALPAAPPLVAAGRPLDRERHCMEGLIVLGILVVIGYSLCHRQAHRCRPPRCIALPYLRCKGRLDQHWLASPGFSETGAELQIQEQSLTPPRLLPHPRHRMSTRRRAEVARLVAAGCLHSHCPICPDQGITPSKLASCGYSRSKGKAHSEGITAALQ